MLDVGIVMVSEDAETAITVTVRRERRLDRCIVYGFQGERKPTTACVVGVCCSDGDDVKLQSH